MPNFYQDEAPQASGPQNSAYAQQLAQMLMKGQQGQTAGGQYVPPNPMSYANQLAGGVMKGYQGQQQAGANRAQDILNGGAGTGPGMQTLGQQAGSWLGGLFGGA